jgi:peroxiredoxin family protein
MMPNDDLIRRVESLEAEILKLKSAGAGGPGAGTNNKVCLVVFSGTLDKILAALNIATGAASMGCEVNIFFTFWGTPAMRKKKSGKRKKPMVDRIFGAMLPSGTGGLKLSTMHWGGLGTAMIRRRMKAKHTADVEMLLKMAEELHVKMFICEMSMDLMGMTMDDLRAYPGMEPCGVGSFMELALNSRVALFI